MNTLSVQFRILLLRRDQSLQVLIRILPHLEELLVRTGMELPVNSTRLSIDDLRFTNTYSGKPIFFKR
ncbi:MAG: hypothetical protein O7C75_07085, partial [Verrucomicrobia bacterium]|nr:hypothetical protein [Verrucomicrobiota bacterium]